MPMHLETFCGGMVETNGYLVSDDGVAVAVDAPEGMADFVASALGKRGAKLAALLLTHGHWDHIVDAAAIQGRFGTPVFIHRDSSPLIERPEIQAAFHPLSAIPPCTPDRRLDAEREMEIGPFRFGLLFCPGHCPGSLSFHLAAAKWLFGGDVLFARSVGRWDLPGGSREDLLSSIREKMFVLPEETVVYPGHGPATTIGRERCFNPYVS